MNNQNSCNCNQNGARNGGNCGCGSSNAWQRRTGCGCGGTSPLQRRTDCGCDSASTWQRRSGCSCNNADTWQRRKNCGCGGTSPLQRRTDCGCDGESITRTTVTKTDCDGDTYTTVTRTAFDDDFKENTCGYNEAVPARSGCACATGVPADSCLHGRSLAMVYPPHQEFTDLYDPRQGLCNGTVFCELNKPFYGSGYNR